MRKQSFVNIMSIVLEKKKRQEIKFIGFKTYIRASHTWIELHTSISIRYNVRILPICRLCAQITLRYSSSFYYFSLDRFSSLFFDTLSFTPVCMFLLPLYLIFDIFFSYFYFFFLFFLFFALTLKLLLITLSIFYYVNCTRFTVHEFSFIDWITLWIAWRKRRQKKEDCISMYIEWIEWEETINEFWK